MHCGPHQIAITEQALIPHHSWVHCAPIDEVVDRAATAIVQNQRMDAAAGRHRSPAEILDKFIQRYKISDTDAALLRSRVLQPGFLDQYHIEQVPFEGGASGSETLQVVVGPYNKSALPVRVTETTSFADSASGQSSRPTTFAPQLETFLQELVAKMEGLRKSPPSVLVLPSGSTAPAIPAHSSIDWDLVIKGLLIGVGIVILLKSRK